MHAEVCHADQYKKLSGPSHRRGSPGKSAAPTAIPLACCGFTDTCMGSFHQSLCERALENPTRPAMVHGDYVANYQSFFLSIELRRRWLEEHGVAANSTVVLWISSQTQSWLLLLALRALGARTISISNLAQIQDLGLAAFEHLVMLQSDYDHPANAAAVTAAGLQPLLIASRFDISGLRLSAIDETPADTGSGGHIVYTSGTTGSYKKLLMNAAHDYQVSVARAQHFGYRCSTVFGDAGMGLWTAIGYKQPLAVWAAGGCVVFPAPGRQWADFNKYRVTDAYFIPSGVVELLKQVAPSERPHLDFRLLVGAGFLSEKLTWTVLSKLTKRLSITYGSTEISLPPMQADVASAADIYWYRPTEAGRVEIVDDAGQCCPTGKEGDLRIRTSELDYQGYLADQETTEKIFRNGFFYPGDRGVARADGAIRITGRVADVLVVNGQKIATSPIEQSLQKLLRVNEVCVFSGADREGEELVVVAVETAQRKVDFGSIAKMLNPQLFQKVLCVCLERFPRNDTGTQKIKRDVLKRQLFERFGK